MKKEKSDALVQRLVNNKISRSEFNELLNSLEDEDFAVYLEASMKEYFEAIMEKYKEENQNDKKVDTTLNKNKQV